MKRSRLKFYKKVFENIDKLTDGNTQIKCRILQNIWKRLYCDENENMATLKFMYEIGNALDEIQKKSLDEIQKNRS